MNDHGDFPLEEDVDMDRWAAALRSATEEESEEEEEEIEYDNVWSLEEIEVEEEIEHDTALSVEESEEEKEIEYGAQEEQQDDITTQSMTLDNVEIEEGESELEENQSDGSVYGDSVAGNASIGE